MTNPASPSAVADGFIVNGTNGFSHIGSPRDITTISIGSNTYALVVSFHDNAVQIINMTNPASPSAVADGFIVHGTNGFGTLDFPLSITSVDIRSKIYALATTSGSYAVQIINMTNPASPSAVADGFIVDETNGFSNLRVPRDIATVHIGTNTYALVTSQNDDAVQIIELAALTEPISLIAIPSIDLVSLSWTEPADSGNSSIIDYIVEYSDNSGTTWSVFDDGVGTGTGATVTDLIGGQEYSFRVSAENDGGTGTASIITATPIAASCGFDIPSTLDFNDLSRNEHGIEVTDIWAALGNTPGTLELLATDWIGIDSQMHLFANATRYSITTDGSDSSGVSYESKTAIGDHNINTVIVPLTDYNNPLKVSFQISGIDTLENLPYSGVITQNMTFTTTCN